MDIIQQTKTSENPLSRVATKSLIKNPKILNNLLYIKYGDITEDYCSLNMDALIFSKSCHLTATLKDKVLCNNFYEYLNRYYMKYESNERIPRISNYYLNYSRFFSIPLFKNFRINKIIQDYGENKAEVFYKKIHKNKSDTHDKKSSEKNKFSLLFSTTIKDNIDQHILTQSGNNWDSYIFSSINLKCDYSNKREDSILKILSSLGEDIDYRFKGKNNKRIENFKTNIKSSYSTADRTKPEFDVVTSINSTPMILKNTNIIQKVRKISEKSNQTKSFILKNNQSPKKIKSKKLSLYSIYKGNSLGISTEKFTNEMRKTKNSITIEHNNKISKSTEKIIKRKNFNQLGINNMLNEKIDESKNPFKNSLKNPLNIKLRNPSLKSLNIKAIDYNSNFSSKLVSYIENSNKIISGNNNTRITKSINKQHVRNKSNDLKKENIKNKNLLIRNNNSTKGSRERKLNEDIKINKPMIVFKKN